ncbi:MAG TPA: OmpA family protein [Polyangiaceae bacterium]|nr:OmpA family protein [Polyangiaceae bacterium]
MRRFFSSLVLALSPMLLARAAFAETTTRGFALDRFEPSERGSRWFTLESLDFGLSRRAARTSGFAAGAVFDYARQPLVFRDPEGNRTADYVGHQLFAHLGASVAVLPNLRLALNLPVALVDSGDGGRIADTQYALSGGAQLGDVRIGVLYRLLRLPTNLLRAGVSLDFGLPTGSRSAFTGDGGVRISTNLHVAGDVSKVSYGLRLGPRWHAQTDNFAGVPFGADLVFAGSLGLRALSDRLLLGPEFFASTVLSDGGDGFFAPNSTPLEVLLGAHYDLESDVRIGVGAGRGLTQALGTPAFRVVASVEWVPGGLSDKAPATPPDTDRDGIADAYDACPLQPGIASKLLAENGCPPRDTDLDTVPDALDACPAEPGVAANSPRENGCPRKPPIVDQDHDGVLDPEDDCPTEPGQASAHGCPLVKISAGQIVIVEQVQFNKGSADIAEESHHVLEEVERVISAHPELTKISVEGHTDARGPRDLNQLLSARRAAAVVTWLVKRGVAAKRLSSRGFGPDRPIADNEQEEGRQKNRRVEFRIVELDGKPTQTDKPAKPTPEKAPPQKPAQPGETAP